MLNQEYFGPLGVRTMIVICLLVVFAIQGGLIEVVIVH